MKKSTRKIMAIVCTMALVGIMTGTVQAQTTYTWTNTVGGAKNWIDGANWLGGSAPSPISGDTVNLTANIAADTTLTLGGDRTAEFWSFGHNSSTKNWIVNTGNKIILAGTTPTIKVVKNTATLNNVLDGTAGMKKDGAGTLVLNNGVVNTFTGPIILNGGTLSTASLNTLGSAGDITFTGSAWISPPHSVTPTFAKSVIVNPGVTATFYMISQFYNMSFTGPLTGSGTVYLLGPGGGAAGSLSFKSDSNTFTGTLEISSQGNSSVPLTVNSLPDSTDPIKFTGTSYPGDFVLGTGSATPLLFNSRQIELGGTTQGGNIRNNNATSGNTITINTGLRISATGNKTLTLGGSNIGDNTFAGSITNGASAVISITKADAGKWILSGTNTYSGATSVTAGKLVSVVGGSCSNSAVTVSGGTLGVSVTDTTMNWACKSLTHTAASTLEFAFGGNTPSTTMAPLQVNGNVLFVVAPTVSCTGSSLPAGTYPLMTWTDAFFGVVPSSPTLPSGFTGLLVLDNATKTLWLSVSASGSSKQPLTWKGPAGSSWVVNETVYTKWQDATTPTPVSTNYQETTVGGITVGDNVVFGTTGAGTVTLNTIVSPASVSVNTTANYTFSGTGSIAGPGALTKANSGSLTLSTTNGYSGGTLLSAGTLSIGINDALGIGPVVLGGGTIQSSDATVRTLNNPVVLNGTTTVGGTGNLSFTSPGAGSVAAASTLTISGSLNATFATAFGGSGALTKAGTGTMTLTGTNTYGGATTVSAGRLVVNAGQIANNAAVSVTGGNSTMVITNGANVFSGGTLSQIGNNNNNNLLLVVGSGAIGGPASLWDLGSAALNLGGSSGSSGSNNVLRVDGAGVYGGAVVTNVNQAFSTVPNGGTGHNTAPYCSIVLTNGGHFFNKGSLTIGNNYYNTAGRGGNDDSLIIVGGAANSMYYGSSSAVVVGDGVRGNTINNQIFVGAGGVLTNAGYNAGDRYVDFVVGHARESQSPFNAISNNRLVVTDGGQVFPLGNITVGYNANSSVYGAANNAVLIANGGLVRAPGALNIGVSASGTGLVSYNGLTIATGGQLFISADSTIGRAAANGTVAINNSASISGANSFWNLGNKNLFVGSKTGTGVATGNVLRASAGGMATNINALIVSAANTLSLGSGGQIYANAVTNSGTLAAGLDKNATPVSGNLAVAGNLNVSSAALDVSLTGTPTGTYVIASYGSLTGSFAATNGLPGTYKLEMNYKGQKQIAIVYSAAGTIIQFQ